MSAKIEIVVNAGSEDPSAVVERMKKALDRARPTCDECSCLATTKLEFQVTATGSFVCGYACDDERHRALVRAKTEDRVVKGQTK